MTVTEETRLLSGTQNRVTSNGEDEIPAQSIPQSWSAARKWAVTVFISLYALVGPTSASMVVPALPQISQDLGLSSETATQAIVSLFILGWSLGQVVMGPLSERYGRVRLLNGAHAVLLLMTLLCSFEINGSRFLLWRLLGGIAGSAPLAVGSGVMSDLWGAKKRGKSLAIFFAIPLTGTALGPISGAFMVENFNWRWVFWMNAIFVASTLAIGLVCLQETFPPAIAKIQARNKPGYEPMGANTPVSEGTLKKLFQVDLPRPFILLATQPIIQLLAFYTAYLFGLTHMIMSTFQTLWREQYQQSGTTASLHYIAIMLGSLIGCEIAGPLNDKIYSRHKKDNNGIGLPEFRTYMMIPVSFLVPVGMLCYGWAAEMHLHWILPDIGMFITAFGLVIPSQCIQAYLLDCYPVYAASAIASLTVLRSAAGCIFPLIGPLLFRNLGYGYASTLLSGIAIAVGCVPPLILRRMGPALRERSPYGAGHVKVVL